MSSTSIPAAPTAGPLDPTTPIDPTPPRPDDLRTGDRPRHRPAVGHAGRGRRPRTDPGTEIAVFLGTVAALLTVSTAVGIAEGVDAGRIAGASPLGQAVMYGQATVPLVAALVARRVAGRSGAPGLGFRRPTLRSLARAWLYGTATVLGGAALVWATGLGGFAAGEVGPGVRSGGPRSRDGVHRGWTARYGHRDFP